MQTRKTLGRECTRMHAKCEVIFGMRAFAQRSQLVISGGVYFGYFVQFVVRRDKPA
jgi:hypothetical protein